eukprot:scaffold766_cov167-Ochromonas_danica.AAC.10
MTIGTRRFILSISQRRLFSHLKRKVPTWAALKAEAKEMVAHDPFIATLVKESILDHDSFGAAISHNLSHQFADIIGANEWENLFSAVYKDDIVYDHNMATPAELGLLDLKAVVERDPACDGLVNPFLYFKGYKAIQAHRIAHILWRTDRKNAARAVQSRCSELFGVDIHPAAVIDEGLMIDHGTGVVIGETAVVGKNCSFLHGVTLGSTGKNKGDRHPKLGNDVLVGCGTTILGNIRIGNSCKIGSGSMVLKPLPDGATAVGNPARIVGRSLDKSSAANMDVGLKYVLTSDGRTWENTLSATAEEKWINTIGDHVII